MSTAVLQLRPGARPDAAGQACRVWSEHAADLACGLETVLERWPATPSTERMIADGLLRPLGRGVFLPPREDLSAPERAVALGCTIGADLRPGFVIAASSAAWVHVGGSPPAVTSILSPERPVPLAGVRVRQAALRRGEVEAVGGCPVVVPGRAAIDVLRFEPGAASDRLVRDLVRSGHLAESEVALRLRRCASLPFVRTAHERWERILSVLGPPRPG